MQEGDSREESISELILGNLFKYEQTTAELANKLNFVDQEGNARYNMIDRALKKLKKKGWIEGRKIKAERSGNNPTSYSFEYNLQNLIQILEVYPNLMSKMQKNDFITGNISCHYLNFLYGPNDIEYLDNIFWESAKKDWLIEYLDSRVWKNAEKKWPREYLDDRVWESVKKDWPREHLDNRFWLSAKKDWLREFVDRIVWESAKKDWHREYLDSRVWESAKKDWPIKLSIAIPLRSFLNYDSSKKGWMGTSLIDKIITEFQEKLRLSPEFFRLFLTDDQDKLITNIKKFVKLAENMKNITDWEYPQNPYNWMTVNGTIVGINIAFEACVSMDIIKGQSNREAIEYLTQTKKEISAA
jgi:hypothetical protein